MPSSPASAADTAPAPETVRLSGVGFGYADAPGILRDVNLILPRGSFHFLTGPSGAGKSSLLRLFQSLNRLGATVLIASHDQALAERSGARVLHLHKGGLYEAAA